VASLGDLTLFISAETDRAQKDIEGLGKEADKIVGQKRELGFSLKNARNSIRQFKRDLQSAGEAAKLAFKVAKMEGFLDDEIESAETLAKTTKRIGVGLNEARKPGKLLKRTFDGLASSTVGVVNGLAKIGFALYGIQQVTGVLKQAFGGFFNATLGQNIQLREQILKTQTALASTNDVFADGVRIDEPLKAIEALTGAIEDRIESIRERSLDLAGVTSSQVIEVFGITAQQIGQIGGSLKDAEDLAISFSAALGTFGIPLYQARQEVGSILRGDITQDSYLAKALGITPDDVSKAKNSTEGLVAFLEKKLEAAVAGQAIAAKSFSGVVSNLADFQELIGQRFGAPLLDPLLAGLNQVYALLVSVKEEAFGAATALGEGLANAARFVASATGAKASTAGVNQGSLQGAGQNAEMEIRNLSARIAAFGVELQNVVANILLQLGDIIAKIGAGIKALASAFVGLNVGVFKSLLNTFELLLEVVRSLAPAFADLLKVYAGFLNTPLIKYLAELGAQFKLLEAVGVTSIVKLVLVGKTLAASWAGIVAAIKTGLALINAAIAKTLGFIGTVFAAAGQTVAVFATKLAATVPAASALAVALQKVAASATASSVGMKKAGISSNFLVGGFKKAAAAAIIFNLKLMAIVGVIALVIKAYGDFRRSQERAAQSARADNAYKRLSTSLKDVTDQSSKAAQAQRELEMSILSAAVAADKKLWVDAYEKVERLNAEYEELKKNADKVDSLTYGGMGAISQDPGLKKLQLDKAIAEKEKAEKAYLDRLAKYEEVQTAANIDKEVETRSKQLGQLNEKLAKAQLDLQRRVAQDKFNAEQELAQKQLEYARALEQERIELAADRNRKLIEGEEGASAAALQGLVEYAKTRNEQEADIENKRHQRVLAVQRLENEIENYKFQIGQRVLELKKQGAKIDKETAEYVQKVYQQIALQRTNTANTEAQQAQKALPMAVTGSARVGNTGRSTGPHIDIRGSNEASVLRDAMNLIRAWQELDVEYIYLSNLKKHVKAVSDPAVLMDLLRQEMAVHGKRVSKGTHAIDIAVPEGTVIPGATAVSQEQHGAAGHMATMKGSGNKILHLMNPATAAGLNKPSSTSLDNALNAPTFEPPDLSAYEEAKKATQGIIEQLEDSQQRLSALANDRKLKSALDQLVPKAAVEQYEDAIIRVRQFAEAVKEGNNPEQAEIVADLEARRVIAARELQQFLERNAEIFKEDAATRDEVAAKARTLFDERVAQFDTERDKRLELLAIEQNINAARQLAADTKSNALTTNQALVTGEANLLAGVEYSPFDRRRIQAEGNIEARRMQEEDRLGGPLTGDALERFEQFKEQELINAEKMAQLDAMTEKFQLLGDVAAGIGNSISTAFTQGFADILSGSASVQEVLGNMFKGIADSFMQMAQKIIADMIKMLIYKSLLGLFGGGSSEDSGSGLTGLFGGSPGGNDSFAGVPNNILDSVLQSANGNVLRGGFQAFAKGGIVKAPTLGLIGEGGKNEAVVPLPDGRAIPVDFGKKGKIGGDITSNVTVNIDQSGGSKTEMSGDEAGKLGKAIDVAVKRVIMEERRSGGLLHNGRR